MSAFNLRACAAVFAPVLAVSGALIAASPAQAVSANVVISEVYGGGGNSGAPWKSDFVELYNRSDAAPSTSSVGSSSTTPREAGPAARRR